MNILLQYHQKWALISLCSRIAASRTGCKKIPTISPFPFRPNVFSPHAREFIVCYKTSPTITSPLTGQSIILHAAKSSSGTAICIRLCAWRFSFRLISTQTIFSPFFFHIPKQPGAIEYNARVKRCKTRGRVFCASGSFGPWLSRHCPFLDSSNVSCNENRIFYVEAFAFMFFSSLHSFFCVSSRK